MLSFLIHPTIRDGEKRLVEIKDTNSYYANIELLIPKSTEEIREAVKRLKEGKGNLPPNFDLYQAFVNLVDRKLEEENVKVLLNKYFEVVASEVIYLEYIYNPFKARGNLIVDEQRFKVFMDKSDKILRKYVLQLNSFDAMVFYVKYTTIKTELIIKNIGHLEQTIRKRWEALTQGGKVPVEGKQGAKYLIDDYSDYFELLQKLLKELATLINNDTKEYDCIDTFYKIDNVLKKNGYTDLVSPLIVQLRHSGTHWDIDYTEKGKVSLYDSNSKQNKPVLEITYQKLVDKLKTIKDLTWAVFFSYIMWREIVFFRCLESAEFKFHLIENVRP